MSDDNLCCDCGGGKGYMPAPKGSIYEGMWVCVPCEKPRRLYFERTYERAKLQSGNRHAE